MLKDINIETFYIMTLVGFGNSCVADSVSDGQILLH